MTSPALAPRRVAIADVPDLEAHVRALGFLTPADAARLDAIERARFILVRNDGGERWRCGRCGRRHEFYTVHCVPFPMRGIAHGLYAVLRNLGDVDPRDLSPEQRARLAAFEVKAAGGRSIPLLAARHPNWARTLATPKGSADYVTWALGSVEEIAEAQARAYATQINAKARRIVVRL